MTKEFSYEKAFSLSVRRLRKKLNMTQKSLADAIGYSEKTDAISGAECGEMRVIFEHDISEDGA